MANELNRKTKVLRELVRYCPIFGG